MDEKDLKVIKDLSDKLELMTAQLTTEKTNAVDLRKEIDTVKQQLEALKALPAGQIRLPEVKVREKVFGYDLAKQGLMFKNMDEETKDRISKWLITVIHNKFAQKAYGDTALQEGTPSEGGVLVPTEFTAALIEAALLASFALNECTVWPMAGLTRKVPALATDVSVAWTAEESDFTETEPVFDEITLTAKKLGAIGLMSNELLQDSAIDIVSVLTRRLGNAIGQELDKQVLIGTGSPWTGIGYDSDVYMVRTDSTAVTDVKIEYASEMIDQLSANYRTNAKFVFHRKSLGLMRVQKATDSGVLMWGNAALGQPPTLWGYPIIESEQIYAPQADKPIGVFGNLQNFSIGQRLAGATLDLDPYSYFKSYRTQYRIVTRWGGSVGLAAAFVRIVVL